MARKPVVSRTIKSTIVNAKVYKSSTDSVETQNISLAGTFDTEEQLDKALRKATKGADIQVLAVLGTEVNEALYVMDENKFIELADVQPPRGTKVSE